MKTRSLIALCVGLLACVPDTRMDDPKPDTPVPGQNPPAGGPSTPAPTQIVFPPGAMMAFAGPVAPAGWWLCDGKAVNSADYPELFKAIGSSWGDGGDGAGPLFNIPDMRGLFPRGVDSGAKRDPEAEARTAITQGGNTGDRVGAVQEFSTSVPKKPVQMPATRYYYTGGLVGGSRDIAENPTLGPITLQGGDAETRPRNVGVNWIVKY